MNEYPDTWPDTYVARLKEIGSPITRVTTGGVWMQVETSRQRFISFREAWKELQEIESASSHLSVPTVIVKGDVNHFANGNWRWVEHSKHRDVIEDFADQKARAEWPGYKVVRGEDGRVLREGPEPFKTVEEQNEYTRRFGFAVAGAGDMQRENPYAEEFKKYPRLKELFPEFVNWGKRGRKSIDQSELKEVSHVEAVQEEG